MKNCPHCRKQLPETAIRCKYCRRPLSAFKRQPSVISWIKKITNINLEGHSVPWSLKEVFILWLLVFAANFVLEHYEITSLAMDFLKKRYFILVKEPALQFHIYIFISTFILKLSAVFVIWLILKMHKAQFISGLKLDTHIKKEWFWVFPAFFIFSAISRLTIDTDPLSPNLPIYLFFKESSIIGTALTLFSLSIIAPISEEIFFRGFIYPAINKRFGLYLSVLITALMFTAVHIPQCKDHLFILFTIFLGGILLTSARALTKSTLMAILLHLTYNVTITAVGFIKFLIFKY